jgi:cytochrome P450
MEAAVLDPFVPTVRGIAEPNPVHDMLRAAGPLVRVAAPAGGPAWVVTDYALARQVLAHPDIAKDPAFAPPGWGPMPEPTAAEQMSLTTLDGPEHARLRQAHTPLFTARRMQEHAGRMREIARDLLSEAATADLTEDFTIRYPLAVLCDLLGVPMNRVDDAIVACRRMFSDNPVEVAMAMGGFAQLAAAALVGDGLAAELRDRVPDGTSEADLQYLIFTLLFAGQLTTDTALGFVIAYELGGDLRGRPSDEIVREATRRHPSAPYSLWRFTTSEIELAGERLPARSPVLVDIIGINACPGPDLTYGAGPHYCTGAQLAHLEMCAVVDVLRADFPDAALAVPFAELRQADLGGIQASRLTSLPVTLAA